MIWLAIILGAGLTFAIVESYNDRHGETKKEKVKDSLLLIVATSLLCFVAWCVAGINPLKTGALILAVRILVFDPLVNFFLKKYSEDHKNINIWTYVGTTSTIDRIVSKVNWKVRLAVRTSLFGLSVWFFLS